MGNNNSKPMVDLRVGETYIGSIESTPKEFGDILYETMEEMFPEFIWNGELVKSTKYVPEEE